MRSIPTLPKRALLFIIPIAVILFFLPLLVAPYQVTLITYGLIFAIAALGFNLLLGCTGLLSFGHSAYFGMGAYAVAFIVKYLNITSMEVFLLGGVLASATRGSSSVSSRWRCPKCFGAWPLSSIG
jgi:branched-chain amino acid transport system permease protein